MNPIDLEKIQKSFEIQAENFENTSMNFSQKEYLDYIVSRIKPLPANCVLEVAAGTCVCGRALAPFTQTVTCLDTTPAMLEVGKREAENSHLNNMVFIKGDAGNLPFLDSSFDIVVSRLAFHHFADVKRPFQEMVRVLKPSGKLVLIDMEAAEEKLRVNQDEIETLRDPSHIKNLSRDEMINLYKKNSLKIETCEKREISVSLDAWMKLTNTPEIIKEDILSRMMSEINGYTKSGFSPYLKEKEVFFNQRWILTIGKKP